MVCLEQGVEIWLSARTYRTIYADAETGSGNFGVCTRADRGFRSLTLPDRNRMMSGLSDGVLVIAASRREWLVDHGRVCIGTGQRSIYCAGKYFRLKLCGW